jgi:hypothetical protein
MSKENVAQTHSGIVFSREKEGILPCETARVDPADIVLSGSQFQDGFFRIPLGREQGV